MTEAVTDLRCKAFHRGGGRGIVHGDDLSASRGRWFTRSGEGRSFLWEQGGLRIGPSEGTRGNEATRTGASGGSRDAPPGSGSTRDGSGRIREERFAAPQPFEAPHPRGCVSPPGPTKGRRARPGNCRSSEYTSSLLLA